MNKKIFFLALIFLAVFGFSNFALAQSTPGSGFSRGSGRGGARPGVFGTVTAVNGNTITVQSRGFGQNSTQTTYTVDASNATVTKNNAASSVGDIAVGDNIMVQGTVSGTSVTAKTIRDGIPQARNGQQKPPAQNSGNAQNNSNPSGGNPAPKSDNSLWGILVGFFKNLFGFK